MNHPVNDIEDFIDVWVRSELTTQAQANELLAAYCSEFLRGSPLPDTISAFCTYLVSIAALTCWQCQKLRHGKWKGFRLDHYELADSLGSDDEYGYFLARDLKHGAYVRLAILPWDRTNGTRIEYHVAEEFD